MKYKISTIMLFLIILGACRKARVLPEGNISILNSKKNEIAPTQVPIGAIKNADPCFNEFAAVSPDNERNIIPANEILEIITGYDGALNSGAVSFISENYGFLSVAHPKDPNAALFMELPIGGGVGGTDIFEFDKDGEKYVFANPGKDINSRFWDSHPCALSNGKDILLIWSSDRPDYKKGYGSPFQYQKALDMGSDTISGNSDLYFAFRKNGEWTEPVNFAEINPEINTKFSEITPFVYCQCYNPVLIFSSDRDSTSINDFDLYSVNIEIDYDRQNLKLTAPVKKLLNFPDSVSQSAKDFYPFIPRPYKQTNDSVKPFLYFSSNRYKQKFKKSFDTLVAAKGGFDFYKFPVDLNCRQPKTEIKINIVDAEAPGRPVKEPYIELREALPPDYQREVSIAKVSAASASFSLESGRKYRAYGGSMYDEINCEGTDSVMSHYSWPKALPPRIEIQERIVTEKYDTVISPEYYTLYDTSYYNKKFHTSETDRIKSNEMLEIKNISMNGDSVTVSFMEITSRDSLISGYIKPMERLVTVNDTLTILDTTFMRTVNHPAMSELSKQKLFPDFIAENDTVIDDIVYLQPRYYYFPPCRWEFVEHIDEYRRNIPYFQTGFWEVNTVENLERHIKELKNREYAGASFIELHPENQYFGYKRYGLEDEEKRNRRVKYAVRLEEYRDYAREVDNNLNIIKQEICSNILPAFNELNLKTGGNNNKIIIQINSYSDRRPIKKGDYTGSKSVFYYSGSYNDITEKYNIRPVKVEPGTSLVSENNANLSRLRAYFGYKALFDVLMSDSLFADLVSSGDVLLPDRFFTESEFKAKFDNASVIFFIEGRQIDTEADFKHKGYVGKEDDYYSLDPVRRINVVINRIEYIDGRIQKSPCCSEQNNIDK